MATKVLITGATGFVGSTLLQFLREKSYDVLGTVRTATLAPDFVLAPELSAVSDWHTVLAGREVVVHTAARAHVLRETEVNPLAVFREVNTAGTLNLARQAAAAGVHRLIFISSIGVNGLFTRAGEYLTEQSPHAPHNHYAISKWEAEQGLLEIACKTGLEVVILRPPLVYGPGVGANFLRLLQIVERGWPLPLGAIHNHRSLLYLGNLTDAIRLCIEHPAAAGQTFLLDDGQPISSPELIRAIAYAMHRPARLLSVPIDLLRLAGRVTGKSAAVSGLTGSLHVDSRAIRQRLGWIAPYSMQQGLAATVAAFVQDRASGRSQKS